MPPSFSRAPPPPHFFLSLCCFSFFLFFPHLSGGETTEWGGFIFIPLTSTLSVGCTWVVWYLVIICKTLYSKGYVTVERDRYDKTWEGKGTWRSIKEYNRWMNTFFKGHQHKATSSFETQFIAAFRLPIFFTVLFYGYAYLIYFILFFILSKTPCKALVLGFITCFGGFRTWLPAVSFPILFLIICKCV